MRAWCCPSAPTPTTPHRTFFFGLNIDSLERGEPAATGFVPNSFASEMEPQPKSPAARPG
jgi:hypothetical protein